MTPEQSETLIRLDERTKRIEDNLRDFATKGEVKAFRAEFRLVRMIVFGGVGLTLMSMLGAVIATVIKQ